MTSDPRGEPELEVVLHRREVVADGVVQLTFTRVDGAVFPVWEPGAHLDLVLGPDLVRQYSLCGDPDDRTALTVAVLNVPNSRGGSRRIHEELTEGDRLRLRGPRNTFRFRSATRYVFVAGGIGITPLMPMVAAAAATGAQWHLIYGGRSRSSMAFHEKLTAAHGDRVSVVAEDENGVLDLDTLLAQPDTRTRVYCCGPEPLLRAVEERSASWPAETLHVERFAAAPTDTGLQSAFEVELAGTGTTLHVPGDRSVLEVLEEAGVPVLSSCRQGTCGTCETAVLDGLVLHRDALLTEEERASGEVMMVCVSRARTPRLVLDL